MEIDVYNFRDVTGATHKEEGVAEVVDDALARGLDAICVISSGNYITALREVAQPYGLIVFNLVNGGLEETFDVRIPNRTLLKTAEERVGVVRSSGFAGSVDDYTDFVPRAYTFRAREILERQPDYVICPAGSGKLWLSIVKEVERQGLETRVLGVTPEGKNGFYFDDSTDIWDLDSIADKLTAPFTALRGVVGDYFGQHDIVQVSERELKRAFRVAKKQGVECEVSAAAGFVVYDKKFQRENGVVGNVVVVSTGTGLEDQIERVHKTKRSGFRRALVPVAVAAGLLGSFVGHQVAYNSLLSVIDFNRDGYLDADELFEANDMSGIFRSKAKNYELDKIRVEEFHEFPNVSLWVLYDQWQLNEKDKEKWVDAYGDDVQVIADVLNRQVENWDELTLDQRRYLGAYRMFHKENAPEIFRCISLQHVKNS